MIRFLGKGMGGPPSKYIFTLSTEALEIRISLYVSCETQYEIDELWEKLSEGGIKERCGWLRDKFGVYWQITPAIAWEMVNDPDPVKAQRAMDAIDGMTKMDIETLRRAYEGS
jgi:predicted 3-demethylubiquinone-9 3-methyltransferase (glyoxalase superfamily)